MAETTQISEEREALELGLREWLDDDDATSAAQWVIEVGWRSPAEVAALRARWVAEALEQVVATESHALDDPFGDLTVAAVTVHRLRVLAAEYRDGRR